jgi:hypothetical protein
MFLLLDQFVPSSSFSVVTSSNFVNMLGLVGGIVRNVEVVGYDKVLLDGLGIGLLANRKQ